MPEMETTCTSTAGLLISSTAVEDSHDDPSGIAMLLIFGRLDH